MTDERAKPYVPAPVPPPSPNPSTVDHSDELAKKSPEFREALRKDEERERRGEFKKDQDVWGRTGAGPDVPKTDPQTSQEREAAKAQREEGYR